MPHSMWSVVLVILFAFIPFAYGQTEDIDFEALRGFATGDHGLSPVRRSSRIEALLVRRDEASELVSRQSICPGTLPVTCSTGSYCCPSGTFCCGKPTTRCCTNHAFCSNPPGFLTFPCCETGAQTCGGTACCIASASCCANSPVGCCPSGYDCCNSTITPCCSSGSTCCGDTCCSSGQTCESGRCITERTNTARFRYNENENGAILRSICKGLNGLSSASFTYSGPPANNRSQIRQNAVRRSRAGCTRNFCKNLIDAGGDPGLDSCEEFPPSNSEGGTVSISPKAVCVPHPQQSFQGSKLSTALVGLIKGGQFTLAANCEDVPTSSPGPTVSRPRENEILDYWDDYQYFIIPFGDLWAGRYSVSVTCITGSVTSSFILDSKGDDRTPSDSSFPSLRTGQTQTFTFTFLFPVGGVGLVLRSPIRGSTFRWTIQGTTFDDVTDQSMLIDDDDDASNKNSEPTSPGNSRSGAEGSMKIPVLMTAILVAISLSWLVFAASY